MQVIATVGLDKKLYTFDSGVKRSLFCTSYEAPFSSLAFREDGLILAAGTSNGRVVFYDVRGKPQPFTVLRAYGSSEVILLFYYYLSLGVILCCPISKILPPWLHPKIIVPMSFHWLSKYLTCLLRCLVFTLQPYCLTYVTLFKHRFFFYYSPCHC